MDRLPANGKPLTMPQVRARSIVEIYEQDGAYFGRIVALFREKGEDPDPICKECSDQRKDQKIIGMNIIEGIRPEGDAFMGGEILDPENGKVYKCKIWLEEGALKVRGYLYFLYRTQTWQKSL